VDVLDGGADDDTYVYATSAAFVTGTAVVDSIADTSGTADRALIGGAISIVSAQSLARASGVDVLAAATDNSTLAHSIVINTDTTLGTIRTIDLSGSTAGASSSTITLTGVTNAVGMTIIGTGGIDTVIGGAGNDTITGGAGVDVLNGGAGNDTYVYATSAEFVTGTAVVDSIADASGTADRALITGAISIASTQSLAGAGGVEGLVAAANAVDTLAHSIVIDTDTTLGSIRTIDLSGSSKTASSSTITLTGVTSAVSTTIIGTGGIDTIVGGAGVDTITGGAGNDTITGGAGADIMTGGIGNDTFAFAAGSSGGAPSASVFDTITDFAAGDIIDYASAVTIVTNSATAAVGVANITAGGLATFAAADDTLAEMITAVEGGIQTGTATAGQAAMFKFGSDSYVFISDGVDGVGTNDVLIKLTGVDVTTAAFDVITVDVGGNFTLG
jgi:Ca2+-binding RTX toxin-like protein